MVEAREISAGHICLYSIERGWGGYDLESAADMLPGEWIHIPRPDEVVIQNYENLEAQKTTTPKVS